MKSTQKMSISEPITFTGAALCVVLGVVVAPQNGGLMWLPLAIAGFLIWQGVQQRNKRLKSSTA